LNPEVLIDISNMAESNHSRPQQHVTSPTDKTTTATSINSSIRSDGDIEQSSKNGSTIRPTGLASSSLSSSTLPPQQQEWPADPTMYQLVGKIGQGAFATVWKAYRLIPTSNTSLVDSMTSTTSTATANTPTALAVSTTNDSVDDRDNAAAEVTNSQSTAVSTASSASLSSNNQNVATCAVKVLNLDHADSTNLAEIRLEVQAMRLLSHPNVLMCHTAFINERNLWLVTPLMEKGSSLHSLQSVRKWVRRHKRQSVQHEHVPAITTQQLPPPPIQMEQHIMYILHETLVGLQYIHDNVQIHRDIKAGNILIDHMGQVKIADFGVSSFLLLQNGSLYQHEKAKTFVGTPCWMAPVRCHFTFLRLELFRCCLYYMK
jgi:serine/threonine protein kinase